MKSGIMSAFNMTWNSLNDFARSHQGDSQQQQQQSIKEEEHEKSEASITEQEGMCEER